MLWFKRSDLEAKIEPGATFRRQAEEKNLVETASVLKVKADAFGIPHVHYNIMYKRPHETIATARGCWRWRVSASVTASAFRRERRLEIGPGSCG